MARTTVPMNCVAPGLVMSPGCAERYTPNAMNATESASASGHDHRAPSTSPSPVTIRRGGPPDVPCDVRRGHVHLSALGHEEERADVHETEERQDPTDQPKHEWHALHAISIGEARVALREPLDELQRGLGDLPPPMVHRQ